MILNGFPGFKQSGTFWENAPLKGEFTNFDNIISNNAPRWYSNMLYKDLESPDRSNRFFRRPRRRQSPSGPFLGLNFPSNSKCGNYMHNISFIKSYPNVGAIISDLKIQIISS